MKTEFYKHIELESDLEELKLLFEENDILFEVSTAETIIDEAIVGSGMFAKYTMKILPEDFKKANKLIKDYKSAQIQIKDFEYLEALSNDELMEILENPSEWSVESEIVASKILNPRGVKISDEKISTVKKEKNFELKLGKDVPAYKQALYFFAIILGFYFGVIFIIAGIAMGYYYAYGRTTDPAGEKYYVYNDKVRMNGKLILYGGIICLFVQLFLLFKIDIF